MMSAEAEIESLKAAGLLIEQWDLDDVKAVAPAVLRHRIVTNFNAEAAERTSESLVTELVVTGGWDGKR